jgi:hypothetical protein
MYTIEYELIEFVNEFNEIETKIISKKSISYPDFYSAINTAAKIRSDDISKNVKVFCFNQEICSFKRIP